MWVTAKILVLLRLAGGLTLLGLSFPVCGGVLVVVFCRHLAGAFVVVRGG